MFEECVLEKFALIADHAKLLVGPSAFNSTAEVPETLHVSYRSQDVLPLFTQMIEIFSKRWQTLDLISMLQELQRAPTKPHGWWLFVSIKDTLSSLPTFQKKGDEHSS